MQMAGAPSATPPAVPDEITFLHTSHVFAHKPIGPRNAARSLISGKRSSSAGLANSQHVPKTLSCMFPRWKGGAALTRPEAGRHLRFAHAGDASAQRLASSLARQVPRSRSACSAQSAGEGKPGCRTPAGAGTAAKAKSAGSCLPTRTHARTSPKVARSCLNHNPSYYCASAPRRTTRHGTRQTFFSSALLRLVRCCHRASATFQRCT